MNSPYDPYVGASTHQPYGFDQYMAFYEHFVVTSASITVTFMNKENDAHSIVILTRNGQTSVPITVLNTAMEQPGSQFTLLGAETSSAGKVVFKDTVNMNQFFSNKVQTERTYWGSASADPSETAVWQLGVASSDGTNPGPIQYTVDIQYVCTLKEPKPVTGS